MDAAQTSPAPSGAGSHFSSLGRRTSARQALRRPTLRPNISRSEFNPVGKAVGVANAAASAGPESRPQPQQYPNLNDSSDDEVFIPMKLSALTKALFNDGQASESSSAVPSTIAPENRQPSPPSRPQSRVATRRNAPAAPKNTDNIDSVRESLRQREPRRHGRSGSVQLPSSRQPSPVRSRETSPAPRKRVVRLSGTPGVVALQKGGVRRSLSASTQRKRPESRESADEKGQQLLSQKDAAPDVNTPSVPVRTVRIVVGSSGQKGRSGRSSGLSSGVSSGHSTKRSATGPLSDQEIPDAPAIVGGLVPGVREGSASRYGTVGRKDEVAIQSSMRVKRTGKVGSFLSGPARRPRRRQSEEDADEQGEGKEVMGSNQEPEYQHPHESGFEPAEAHIPPSLASSYSEMAVFSGSPVRAKNIARALLRKQASDASIAAAQPQEVQPRHAELDYKMPPPPPQLPSTHDKENGGPLSSSNPFRPLSSFMVSKEVEKLERPDCEVLGGSVQKPVNSHASPERKVLALRTHNTPHRAPPPPPPKMSVVEMATASAGASIASQALKKRQLLLRVNGRSYTRIDCIGRGGSSKVYRVAAENGRMLALKRVALENADENTVRGFKGEIDLLRRLRGVDRVIQLIDHELNTEKHLLSVLMELGELDFNTLLRSRQSMPEGAKLDLVFIRYYWKEMVECVQAVHARDVVHSDLKPANFVLTQGRLKVIDFGIANAIQTDMTVNVHRETQIGTPNYMAPESLMDSNQYAFTSAQNGRFCVPPPLQPSRGVPRLMKLGKASDVWSLGCILYQMVYGLPPFGKITNQMSRMQSITDWNYAIDFPNHTEDGSRVPPSIKRTMKRCLNREQKARPTCDELLSETDPFLYTQEFDQAMFAGVADGSVLPINEEILARVISSVVARCQHKLPTEGEALSVWPSRYWMLLRREVAGNTDHESR